MVFSNINGGGILALLDIVALIYLYDKKKINRLLAIFLGVFYTLFILISQARTSILGLIVLILYMIYMNIFKNIELKKIKSILKKFFIIIMAIIFIFLICIILKRNYNSESKIDNTIMNIEEKLADITTLRYWLWKYSIEELIDNNILFGIQADFGEDSFNNINNEELLNSFSASQKDILNRNNMHNGYIQLLIRNGIFGFAFITIFIAKLFLKSIKMERIPRYYIFFILIFIIINLFENHLVLSNSFFVLFLWINIGKNAKILKE